jgi:Guanylate-binding protein, N-terminal domain/Guanylate-binding protein, C-terminal domain
MEDKPILLVDIDESGKCTLNPEAVSYLREIDDNICIASVAGMYRTGKSYLLNRLMGKQHGFEIGPSVNPCTKGIWIWGSPISLPKKKIILIDTEGLGSFDRDQTIDMIIFSLSVLISSTFIYNSMGAIDEQALEDLSLVCKLTQHIHVKSHQGNTSAEAYAQYFPKFIWALRDFALQLVDNDGNSISSDQYLDVCLQQTNENTEENKQKNTIRKILREFFRDRECFTFVRPVNQEKKLRNIQEVPFEELRKEFRDQMNTFVQRVYATAKVKMIDGVAVNGKLLSSLLEIYVESINRDAVPTISTAWERTIEMQIKQAYKNAYDTYKTLIKAIKPNIPMDESALKTSENESRKQGQKIIDNVPVISALKDDIEKIKLKYLEKCDQTLENLLADNYNKSKSKANAFLKDAFEAIEDKIMSSDKFHWVPEEFSQLYDVIPN